MANKKNLRPPIYFLNDFGIDGAIKIWSFSVSKADIGI